LENPFTEYSEKTLVMSQGSRPGADLPLG